MASFKGDEVRVTSLRMEGSELEISCVFRNSITGLVHAQTKHTIKTSDDKDIRASGRQFLLAVENWLTRMHFDNSILQELDLATSEQPQRAQPITQRSIMDQLQSTDPVMDPTERHGIKQE